MVQEFVDSRFRLKGLECLWPQNLGLQGVSVGFCWVVSRIKTQEAATKATPHKAFKQRQVTMHG